MPVLFKYKMYKSPGALIFHINMGKAAIFVTWGEWSQ